MIKIRYKKGKGKKSPSCTLTCSCGCENKIVLYYGDDDGVEIAGLYATKQEWRNALLPFISEVDDGK